MSYRYLIPVALLSFLISFTAYRLFWPVATVDDGKKAPYQDFLVGEMAALTPVLPPEPLSGHMIARPDGSPVKLSELSGTAMLINLWAPWCAPCRIEMEELQAVQEALGDDRFEVVAINVDRGGVGQAREVLAEWGVGGLKAYAEPTMQIAFDLAEGALPTSLIVNADGMVVAQYLGPLAWDKPEGIALFKALKENRILGW